ncbi:MAG: alpha-amylase family glycosyl hydrolase [Candidatus Promineifilaceae bacterium]
MCALSALLVVSCGSEEDVLITAAAPSAPAKQTATGGASSPTTEVEILQTPISLYQGTEGSPWWNDTVFYEVFVRSFQDSDGDGVGDIPGLIERLDYLNDGDDKTSEDLGVTGLWLMPIMESPSYHGYDVVDYLQVDEEYGTEDDFKRLIQEAHERGIRLIVDLVLNHTSREHPWFEEARDPDSDLRDWYIWSEDDPGYTGPWGEEVWHRSGGDYYYGVFWEGMPDLNYENPQVTEEMVDVARFWLEDMGADGFRLDAIKHIIEEGAVQENSDSTHEWLEGFFTFYKDVNPDALAVGEAWTSTDQVLEYTGDEVDVAFQFDLAQAILDTSQTGLARHYLDEMTQVVNSYPPGQYAAFITNHDQNRVMSQLQEEEGAAKVAASLLLTSPGVPFIYYGEEIGMTGTKPDENIRRPMQWSSDNFRVGFTSGSPWRRPSKDYEERSVDLQADDPESLLSHYRSLIQLRNEHEALRIGDWTLVDTGHDELVSFLRHTDSETLLVLINASSDPIADYDLGLESGPLAGDETASIIFGSGALSQLDISDGGGFSDYQPLERLDPYGTYIVEYR